MQDHLKERLTGAAILVVVVVLLVPEMFRGRPVAGIDRSGNSLEGPPLRSYTIDLRDSPAAQPPAMTAMPAMPVRPAAAAGIDAAAPAQASGATVPEAPAPAHAAPAPVAQASAAVAGWTVQVGSFARRDFAERMVKQVRAKGFAVEVAGPDGRGLYRVRSAPGPDRSAALALKQKMQSRGLKPIINVTP